MRLRNKSKFILWLLAAFSFMCLIYFQSAMPYQKQNIRPLLEKTVELKKDTLPAIKFTYDRHVVSTNSPYGFVEFILRKLGHVVEYAILTFLWIQTLKQTTFRWWGILAASFVLSISYAGLDEWHQTIVKGRTGHLIDVLIPDLLGIVLVVFGYVMIQKYIVQKLPESK